jgi:chromate reductase
MHIVAFSGCLREQSYNTAALRALQSLLPQDVELEILSLEDLPVFSASAIETEAVRNFQQKVAQADAVLIATPEYHGLLPHALRNALAWTVRSGETSVLAGKPTAMMGVGRQDSAEEQLTQLRVLLSQSRAAIVEAPEVYLNSGRAQFDARAEQQLRTLLDALVEQVRSALVY